MCVNAKLIDTNKEMYSFNKKIHDELALIYKPLKDYLGLNNSYFRVYNDGKYFFLHSNVEFVKLITMNLEKDIIFCDNYLGNLNNKNGYIYTLWPEKPSDYPSMEMIYNAGYWHGMDVFKRSDNYLDLWSFYHDISNGDANINSNHFIRNIDMINKYIFHFNKFISVYLENYEKKYLAIFPQGFDFTVAEHLPDEYLKMEAFIQELVNLNLNYKGINFKLTPREVEGLKYLSLGNSMKEIAKFMKISPRTVETNFGNIKIKTGIYLRSDLIKMFQDNFLNF